MSRSAIPIPFVVLVALLLAGCGSSYDPDAGVIVRGKIVKGGNPLEVPNREVALGSVDIELVPPERLAADPRAEVIIEVESTSVNADGSFEFLGPGKGIKPGKYKLAVYQRDQGYGSDMLQGAFSPQKTPIEVDVPADKLGDVLDLGTIDLNDHYGG